MRKELNDEELEAHRILDGVKAGIDIPESVVNWALWVCGDLVGQ